MHDERLFIPLHHQRWCRADSVNGISLLDKELGCTPPSGWCLTPGAGPAAPSALAMTSPAWAFRVTWIPWARPGGLGSLSPGPGLNVTVARRQFWSGPPDWQWQPIENRLQAAAGHWGHQGGPSHSRPTTGTEIVIVAISRICCPGRSTMWVLSQTAGLVSKAISAAAF